MARKTLIQNDERVHEALENWKILTEVRYELAKAAYDYQDKATRQVLDQMVNRLRIGASGYITVQINPPHGAQVPVKIDQQHLDFNLLYVATEILKDLAITGIRVGTYTFPPSQCATCGAELIAEKPKPKRKARS